MNDNGKELVPVVGEESDIIEIKCAGCGAPMRVHKPMLLRQANPSISFVILYPAWSVDERICKGCKTLTGPVLAKVELSWVAFRPNQPQEERRIVVPGMQLPPNINPKLKQ
jgi:hypothetical protein